MNYFVEKKTCAYIDKIKEKTHKDIIVNIIKCCNADDMANLKSLLETIQKMNLNSFSLNDMETITIAVISFFERNYEKANTFLCISFLGKFLKRLKSLNSKLQMDWKIFYKMMVFSRGFFFWDDVFTFFNLLRYFTEDKFTEEDYLFMKKEVLTVIYHYKTNFELSKILKRLVFYIPRKYLEKDEEFQNILFNLMKNKIETFENICDVFKMLMKNENALKINITEFIEVFFTRLEQYVKGNDNMNLNSKTFVVIKKVKKKNRSKRKHIEFIFISLLFSKQFEPYREIIDSHLDILIQNIQGKLCEKYNEETSKTRIVSFLNNSFAIINRKLFLHKQFDSQINKKIILPSQTNNTLLYSRFINLIENHFWIIIKKAFLFDIIKSNEMYNSIVSILQFTPDTIKLNKFEDIISYLKFHMSQISRHELFTIKLESLIPLLLKFKKIDFIQESLSFCNTQISSGNPKLGNNILKIYAKIFCYTKHKDDLKKQIIPIILPLTKEVINKILPILDIFTLNSKAYDLFAFSLKSFDETKHLLSKALTSHILNSEIENKYLHFYMRYIDNFEELYKNLIEDLIYVDEDANITIKKHCLFANKDSIKQIEVNVFNEKKIMFYTNIFSNINFSSFDILKYKKSVYNVIYAMFNQKNNKYYHVACALINNLTSLLEFDIDDEVQKIVEPKKEIIEFIIELYNTILIPYEEYINSEENQDETTILIYVSIAKCFIKNYNNIYINYTIDQIENELYAKYNTILINIITKTKALIERLTKDKENNEEQNNQSNILLLYDVISTYLCSITKLSKDPNNQDKLKAFCVYSNYNVSLLYDYSLKKISKLIKINQNTINLFKLTAESKGKLFTDCLALISMRYDTTNDTISNICNELKYDINPKREYLKVVDYIFKKYLEKIETINADSTSFSETLTMEIIVSNYFYLTKLLIEMNKYQFISIANTLLLLYNKINEKKYKKMKELFFIVNDIISYYKQQIEYSNPYYINRNNKYPHIKSLTITKITPNEKYKQYEDENKESINQYKNTILTLKEGFNNEIIQYLNLLYLGIDQNKSYMNNEIDKLSFLLINFDLISNLFGSDSEEKDKMLSQFEKMIYENIKNESISFNIRKMWISLFFVFLRNKYKANVTYTTINIDKDKYNENIIKNYKVPNFVLNSISIDYIGVSLFDKNSFSNSTKSNISVNELYRILYTINDWANDKNLMNQGSNNSHIHIFEILKNFSSVKSSSNFDMLSSLNKMLSSLVRIKYETPKSTNTLSLMYIKLVVYMLLFGYIKYESFTYEEIIKYLNIKEHTSCLTVVELITGLVVYEIKYNNDFTKAKEIVLNVTKSLYSNGINNLNDGLVYSFYNVLTSTMTIDEINKVITPHLFELNVNLTIRIIAQLVEKFKYNSVYFDMNGIVDKTHKLIEEIMTTEDKFVSNYSLILPIISFYFIISKGISFNDKTFEQIKNDNVYEVIAQIISYTTSSSINNENSNSKLILSIYSEFLTRFYDIVFHNSSTLIKFISLISKYISLETDQLKNEAELSKFNKTFNMVTSSCDSIQFIKLINSSLQNSSSLKERTLLLLSIKLLYINNIHYQSKNKKYKSDDVYILLLQSLSLLKDDETLKDSFSDFFVAFYNNLPEKQNVEIVSSNEHYKKLYKENSIPDEDILHALLGQLLRFKIELPDYIQTFIVELGKKYKEGANQKEKKIIKTSITKVINHYHNGFLYMNEHLSQECKETLKEMSVNGSYFT